MTFEEVIGQADAEQRLLQLEREQRIPHAMLFCGPEGCGKMAVALAFASHLLGDSPMLRKWEHPDLHFSYPTVKLPSMAGDRQPVSDDFAKEWHQMLLEGPYFTMNRWIQAMGAANQQAIITAAESDEIARKLSLKSSQGGYKICIIWLPERMNPASANKLLKLLEEPPQQTVFILVSEAPEQLLETIRSRTQRIELRKIDTPSLEQALVERRGIDGEVAHRLARTANGNWNKALEELDAGNENVQFLDMFIMLMRLAYTRNIHDLKKWSEVVATFGREKQKRMLVYFMRMVRENFMFNFRQPELNYMTKAEENFSTKFARFINEANVIDIAGLMDRAVRDISQNANAKIVFFDMALKMIVLLIRK